MEKTQQPNRSRTSNRPDFSGIKIWVAAQVKELLSAKVLAEGKGYIKLVSGKNKKVVISSHYDYIARYQD